MSVHTITRLEGHVAGMEGKPFASNPYSAGTLEFEQFSNGWFNGTELRILTSRVTEDQTCDCTNCECKNK